MDTNLVKKVMTMKSGKFIFSRKYSQEKLLGLLVEARVLYQTVGDLPILPELASQLEEEVIRRSIFGTAAIEGNPLTEEEVGLIISEAGQTKETDRARTEIRNLKTAYDITNALGWTGAASELDEEVIRKIHKTITLGIEHKYNVPGQYRNIRVEVGDRGHGGVYVPPKCLPDIEKLMKEFIGWINSGEVTALEPPIRAALAHYYLALIHPFGDGNGRTARIVEAVMLQAAGIKYAPVMLSNYYYRHMDEYFWAFSNSRKSKGNDVTPFAEFVLNGLIDSLREIKESIVYYIRQFSLRDYYAFLRKDRAITQRQHDFLIILLRHLQPFSLPGLFDVSPFNVLYRDVSERTARRDLKKLTERKLLQVNDDGAYELNLRVLG